MFQYEDLMWLISFPLVCAIMLWFSLDLAVLVRVGSGRRRRANARRAIERLIMASPLASATAASVVQSPSPVSSPTTDRPRTRFDAAASTPAAESTAGYTSSSGNEDNYGGRVRAAAVAAAAGKGNSSSSPSARVRQVVVPAALRIATRAVVRRAVVLVGGDFARSPRMQYHAASLARSGLFDEVLLVGLDSGNLLSEDLLVSGEPQPELIVTREGGSGGSGGSSDATPAGTLAGTTPTSVGAGMEHAVYDVQARLDSSELQPGSGCIVSTCYLAAPPAPPEWLQVVVPLNSLHWVVCTLYRVVALTGLFVLQTVCATATRINEHGQLLVTDLVVVQTPPAVPFVLLIKYLVCPLVFAYNVLLYYGVVVPAAWMNPGAMRDVRQQCRLQSLRFTGTGAGAGRGRRRAAAATPAKAARTSGVLGAARPVRRWVFYPAVVVDWHNFGHTILEQNQRPTTAVQLYKVLEMHLCAGHVNVTVSQAMRRALECAYPRLKRSRARDGATAAAAGVAAAAEDGEVADGLASAPALAGAPPPLSPSPRAVTVLHDVAPAFFKPVPRSHCVRQVLERVLLRHHQPAHNATTTAAVTLTAGNGHGGYTAPAAASSPFALVSKSELENMGWGLAGPPPWIFAEAAAASVPGSPATATAAAAALATTSQRRGIMIVGATSWTEDDDYTVLLQALQRLDHRLQHELAGVATAVGTTNQSSSTGGFGAASGPVNLWVLITGKGPARRRFEEAVRAAKLSSHVVVSTYYAQSYHEYSLLLGAADAGLCLHFSSSGLDLPMKGVDMVGAGLPIIALQYPAIGELMGAVTRVLATQSASRCRGATASTFSNGTADSGSGLGKALPPSLQECERGWLFCTCADLEVLLAAFVGLSAASGTVSDGASCTVLAPPTPLSVMKRRAGEARLHAATWQENWTKVLLPVLKQVV